MKITQLLLSVIGWLSLVEVPLAFGQSYPAIPSLDKPGIQTHGSLAGIIHGTSVIGGTPYLLGWAGQIGFAKPIQVRIYVGKKADQGGTFVGTFLTDQPSTEAVSRFCRTEDVPHQFKIAIPKELRTAYPGQPLYVYAIPPDESSEPPLLLNSPTSGSSKVHAIDLFPVNDYGADPTGNTDSTTAVKAAINAAAASAGRTGRLSEVLFGWGTYKISGSNAGATGKPCFFVTKANNLWISGSGQTASNLVIGNPAAGAFSFFESNNIMVSDFSIDYDPLPFTQGKVIKVYANAFDFQIEDGMPSLDPAVNPYFAAANARWGMLYDRTLPRTKRNIFNSCPTESWTVVSANVFRMQLSKPHIGNVSVGDRYVQVARMYGNALTFTSCRNITIDSANIYTAPGIAVYTGKSSGNFLVNQLHVTWKPGTTRIHSTNADGVHVTSFRGKPVIQNSLMQGMGDDAIHIGSKGGVVSQVNSPSSFQVSLSDPIQANDRLQVIDTTSGKILGIASVASVSNPAANVFAVTITPPGIPGITAGTYPLPTEFKTHYNASTVFNLSAAGRGAVIQNNVVGSFRGFGVRGCQLNGSILNNNFYDLSDSALYLNADYRWRVGPVLNNVLISGNMFRGGDNTNPGANEPHSAQISIIPYKSTPENDRTMSDVRQVSGVRIYDNVFENSSLESIDLIGVKDADLRRNRVYATPTTQRTNIGPVVLVSNSSRVVIDGLFVIDDRPETVTALKIGSDVPCGPTGISYSGINFFKPSNNIPFDYMHTTERFDERICLSSP
jgi:hypothetical protein